LSTQAQSTKYCRW